MLFVARWADLPPPQAKAQPVNDLSGLNRDTFFRRMLGEIAENLEDTVGLEEAMGYISSVGGAVGEDISQLYAAAKGAPMAAEDIGHALVDLKSRIGGTFRIVEQGPDRIVFRNTACPFGDQVTGRPSLCMMTSNVFGTIAADATGYAKVELAETLARGASGCTVVVHLKRNDADGREYFSVRA